MPLRVVGNSSSVSRRNSVRGVTDDTSTTGDAPETVTDSATVEIFNSTSRVATKPTVRRTSRRSSV
jgi:hypothetical protein